jgi:hypothetical protein
VRPRPLGRLPATLLLGHLEPLLPSRTLEPTADEGLVLFCAYRGGAMLLLGVALAALFHELVAPEVADEY